MYQYDVIDKEFLADRSREFREQVDRRLRCAAGRDQIIDQQDALARLHRVAMDLDLVGAVF